jgi:hypothetical protein
VCSSDLGLPVDCAAADDIGHELGAPEEASLAAALGYIETGRCTPPASRLGTRGVSRDEAARPLGWRALLNAQ